MNRQTRILLLILAAVLYYCSMACGADTSVETNYITSLTEEICDSETSSHQEENDIDYFTTPDQALPIARLKRITQSVSPVKVTNERRTRVISYVALPSTIAQHYKQHVTSYLHQSYIIRLSLPPEEIAFPFTAFW